MTRSRSSPKNTVALITLGCPKNAIDSETMEGFLRQAGFEVGVPAALAETIIINTCGFIDPAKRESIDAILEAAKFKTRGLCRRLIVAGCMVERYRDELQKELAEVDAFVGLRETDRILEAAGRPDLQKRFANPRAKPPRVLSTPGHRAYLKISEGCRNRCAYCAIPLIRGDLKSRPREEILAEAKALADAGVVELTLIAQDTTSYGRDQAITGAFSRLLGDLARIDTLEWIRLLYLHPSRVDRKLIDTVAALPRICPYFDIPFQHASGEILRSMGRRGNAAAYLKKIEMIRSTLPGSVIRSSFIVGYPGEDRKRFKELIDFLRASRLDYAGAFMYSRQEGTRAHRLADPVSSKTKERRWHRFMEVQAEITAGRNMERVGTVEQVLVEGEAKGRRAKLAGRTRGQAPEIDGVVYLSGQAKPGQIVRATITDAEVYDLIGRIE